MLRVVLGFTLLFLLFPLVAFGVVPSPTEDLAGFFAGLLDAVGSSEWRVVGAFVLMGVVALVRRYGGRFGLDSGKAAFIASMAIGAALSVSGALAAGASLGGVIGILKLIVNGAITGLVASGLYSGGKKLLEPTPE